MPSAYNTQTSVISGSGPAQALPGGMEDTIKTIHTQSARTSSAYTVDDDTTLANIPGLTVDVEAAGEYAFTAYLPGTATANGGGKFAIGGTCTATSISYAGINYNTTTLNANSATTTKGNAVGAATAVFTYAEIKGTIVVATAGTLTVQFAQNASHADDSTVNTNANFNVTRIA